MSAEKIQVVPVGQVTSSDGHTRLKLETNYAPALQGLEGFSHLNVLFWCHRTATDAHRSELVQRKPYTKGPDMIGVFATRRIREREGVVRSRLRS